MESREKSPKPPKHYSGLYRPMRRCCCRIKPEGENMTAREIVDKALAYREGKALFAWFDLHAALDGVPGAVGRFGSDKALLLESIALLKRESPVMPKLEELFG